MGLSCLHFCDLFNVTHNCFDARLDGRDELPFMLVRIYNGSSNSIKAKEPQAMNHAGDQLRSMHDMHDWDVSPSYKIDHANRAHPVYWSPRSLVNE